MATYLSYTHKNLYHQQLKQTQGECVIPFIKRMIKGQNHNFTQNSSNHSNKKPDPNRTTKIKLNHQITNSWVVERRKVVEQSKSSTTRLAEDPTASIERINIPSCIAMANMSEPLTK